jgi:hypothetical protein
MLPKDLEVGLQYLVGILLHEAISSALVLALTTPYDTTEGKTMHLDEI